MSVLSGLNLEICKGFLILVLIKDTIFMSPTGDGSALLFTWSSEPRQGLVICRA